TLFSISREKQDGALLAFAMQGAIPNETEVWHQAVSQRDKDLINALLDKGVSIDAQDAEGQTALPRLVENEDSEMLHFFIENGADLDVAGPEGRSLLEIATRSGAPNVLRILVEAGLKPTAEPELLELAYQQQDVPAMQLLLNAGLDPDMAHSAGGRIFDKAIADVSVHSVRTLLDSGADVGDNLWAALLTGQDDLVAVMLMNGADPNETRADGVSPVEFALSQEKTHLLQPLLNAGADPNPMYDSKESWLARLIREGDIETATALVKAGASIGEGKATDGHTLLGWSIAHNAPELSLALIEAGVDVSAYERYPAKEAFASKFTHSTFRYSLYKHQRITALMMAAYRKQHDVAQALKDKGAKLTWTNKYQSAVSIGAWTQDVRMMQIAYGRDPDYQPRRIVVDITDQRLTLYENGKRTYSCTVSTGMGGLSGRYATKRGSFVITQKNKDHVSSIYGSEMPYFMRVSCSDFGLHVGNVSSRYASHGCIRLPWDSARKLY
ncbi:MAG: ankyrin repeat domain-containing protein, partial [Verrucomicrobiota bacterium]